MSPRWSDPKDLSRDEYGRPWCFQNELERETSKILSAGIDQEKEIKFSAEAQRVRNELEGLKGAMSDMSNEMKSIQKKMVTESVMERKVKEQVAAAVATLPQAAKRSVKLSSGTTYFWHNDDRLAGGAQGSVFKAMSKEGGQIALKLAEHTTSRNDREHENLMKLKHPNVVKYIGHGMTENNDGYHPLRSFDGRAPISLVE